MSDRPIVYSIGPFAKTTNPSGIYALYCSTASTPKSYMRGGAAYRVPRGKKFVITCIQGTQTTTVNGDTYTVYRSPKDGGTTTEMFIGFAIQNVTGTWPVNLTIPAGEYIVLASASSAVINSIVYGIEVDA